MQVFLLHVNTIVHGKNKQTKTGEKKYERDRKILRYNKWAGFLPT